MRKTTHFGYLDEEGWPNPTEFKPHFLGPHGPYWFPEARSDAAALWGKGADGTEHLLLGKGRIDIELLMWRNPDLGVLLIYSKWGGGYKEMLLQGRSEPSARMGRSYARNAFAGGSVCAHRGSVAGRQGIHRDRRRASQEHRMDCEPRSSAEYVS
jgi:hypothetical protein